MKYLLLLFALLGEPEYYCYEYDGLSFVCYRSRVDFKLRRGVITIKTDRFYIQLVQLTDKTEAAGKVDRLYYFAAEVGKPGSLYYVYELNGIWVIAPTTFNKKTGKPIGKTFAYSLKQLNECK